MDAIESIVGETAVGKVVVFIVVQALVYLILSKSSNIFSKTTPAAASSSSFKPARSVSIRRMLAALADMPAGGEPSPSGKDIKSPTQHSRSKIHDSTY